MNPHHGRQPDPRELVHAGRVGIRIREGAKVGGGNRKGIGGKVHHWSGELMKEGINQRGKGC